ncbi:hypothetical protein MJO28_014038 [Puccinia striiformis f. sp. tritici]|uniref:Uncharacterized protein n=1 Tax=Puccinia striiformis f. sp. tritici TaxID=168172 RepID=A0ACC0DWA6_9BASI|nr:hypothetical protein MJO28_014038 [Puccinia striiformis f. sp. tritici]
MSLQALIPESPQAYTTFRPRFFPQNQEGTGRKPPRDASSAVFPNHPKPSFKIILQPPEAHEPGSQPEGDGVDHRHHA